MSVDADRRGPLHGIGVGVKDIIATTSMPTRNGLADLRRASSAVRRRVRRAVSARGRLRVRQDGHHRVRVLPSGHDVESVESAAHAGRLVVGLGGRGRGGSCPGAIGTQTNGSVIRPAAYCGVVGFKPTKDTIPFDGVHIFSATLDQVGTFARDVAGAALLASALADPGRIAAAMPPPARPPRLAYLAALSVDRRSKPRRRGT